MVQIQGQQIHYQHLIVSINITIIFDQRSKIFNFNSQIIGLAWSLQIKVQKQIKINNCQFGKYITQIQQTINIIALTLNKMQTQIIPQKIHFNNGKTFYITPKIPILPFPSQNCIRADDMRQFHIINKTKVILKYPIDKPTLISQVNNELNRQSECTKKLIQVEQPKQVAQLKEKPSIFKNKRRLKKYTSLQTLVFGQSRKHKIFELKQQKIKNKILKTERNSIKNMIENANQIQDYKTRSTNFELNKQINGKDLLNNFIGCTQAFKAFKNIPAFENYPSFSLKRINETPKSSININLSSRKAEFTPIKDSLQKINSQSNTQKKGDLKILRFESDNTYKSHKFNHQVQKENQSRLNRKEYDFCQQSTLNKRKGNKRQLQSSIEFSNISQDNSTERYFDSSDVIPVLNRISYNNIEIHKKQDLNQYQETIINHNIFMDFQRPNQIQNTKSKVYYQQQIQQKQDSTINQVTSLNIQTKKWTPLQDINKKLPLSLIVVSFMLLLLQIIS